MALILCLFIVIPLLNDICAILLLAYSVSLSLVLKFEKKSIFLYIYAAVCYIYTAFGVPYI